MSKYIFIPAFCLFSLSIYAATPGFYIGAGLGYARLESPNHYLFNPTGNGTTNKKDLGGLGGLLFTGYNFNQYLGIELNYLKPSNSEYKASQSGASAKLKYSAQAVGLLGRFNIPLKYHFGIFAKFGFAYMWQKVKYQNSGVPVNTAQITTPKVGSHHYHKIRPIYGAGVDYHFTDQFSIEALWTMVNMPNEFHSQQNAMADIQYIGMNIAYTF